jgi:hypothetical protein
MVGLILVGLPFFSQAIMVDRIVLYHTFLCLYDAAYLHFAFAYA